ncbi:acyl-CoA dehydrogenase family protein [Shewanella corallii]|uniref:Acyl-CoA dehydrogenase family protein n=1 Tax=Shewanella corallii TaxID=560080 RepID=A0ABT0NAN0_9GAMM|nr:acyl-CoA dehydrogenase family protein [Shewanella corallii]MCL2915519.1 acyl-CoA dehydrogenase family protein [Shewanella corallii]
MNFELSPKAVKYQRQLQDFMQAHVYPVEQDYKQQLEQASNRWSTPPLMTKLKALAREQGLWNLFIPEQFKTFGGVGLSNLEYAPLAELMGRVLWAPEVFNCNAPDTGNMEVLLKYGSAKHQARWLRPLLEGEIRSAYAMTEPQIASSDATNIQCSITREGDNYTVNGRKWFITGAMHENCKIFIVMGKSDPTNPNRHQQQSQILVPADAAGVEIIRPLSTLGYDDAPLGHAEVRFNKVKVPKENLLLGEGRGFEIAQGRLGPGRIHHCMRLIGCAQRALELGCIRANERQTFGKLIGEHQSVREALAQSYTEIQQARLLTLATADAIDKKGAKEARDLIAAAKISVPVMAQAVIDRVMQIHGAGGLSDDWFLAEAFNYARYCRLADGPDEVHMMSLGKQLIKRYSQEPPHG